MTAKEKLDYFYEKGQTPNLIIHGGVGGGKMTLVRSFVNKLYQNHKEYVADYVMYVNCAFAKGIKFIRENLKYFAKTNIHLSGMFKIIVLNNADQLTCDAQSALRRCIEQFSFNTRFIMVTTDKCRLLKPIISRFAEIYVPPRNFHELTVIKAFPFETARDAELRRILASTASLISKVEELYENAFSALDVAKLLDDETWHLEFAKVRGEYRNEKLLLCTVLFRKEATFLVFKEQNGRQPQTNLGGSAV